MTDVTVAPPSAPNPSPQPSQGPSEVVVNQNPSSTPNPIGSQAPNAPVGDIKGSEHRPQSRREAIQAAYERAVNPPSKTPKPLSGEAPKAAEAKAGHNQPPEETPKLDLKKRPVDQPQPRGERGRFEARDKSNEQAGEIRRNADFHSIDPATGQPTRTLPPQAPYSSPPGRFSEAGKKDWAAAPESIRADVHRLQAEFLKAYNVFKGDFEAFKPIKRFHQMAAAHGTTLEQALNNYIGIEQKLRVDPVAALDTIINNLGLVDPQTKQRISLRDVAYHVLNQTPEQLRMIQQGNAQQAATHQIGALHQQISSLQQTLGQMQYNQQFTYTRSAVDQFADSHPRFDELGDVIKQELDLGFDLETAYTRAEKLRPATQAAQTRTASAQTRTPDRSIRGSPDVAPSDGASRRPREASGSPRDAVKNALNRMNGHV